MIIYDGDVSLTFFGTPTKETSLLQLRNHGASKAGATYATIRQAEMEAICRMWLKLHLGQAEVGTSVRDEDWSMFLAPDRIEVRSYYRSTFGRLMLAVPPSHLDKFIHLWTNLKCELDLRPT